MPATGPYRAIVRGHLRRFDRQARSQL